MEFLSDDPTFAAAALGMAALVFLILLRVTQQGKYLFWAGGALLVLVALLGIERVWVTDAERVEATVYGLAKAVERSDGTAAAEFLTSDCVLEPSIDRGNRLVQFVSSRFAGPVSRERLEGELPRYKFDYIRITGLKTRAGEMSRTGTAEFVVHVMGLQQDPSPAGLMTPASGMGWTLGFREESPGVWKVSRITPGRIGGG